MNIPALKEIVEERKEKAIDSLSSSFAKNKLPLEEYERLVEYINKIESERELVVVEKMVAEYGAGSGEPGFYLGAYSAQHFAAQDQFRNKAFTGGKSVADNCQRASAVFQQAQGINSRAQ
jgi:hypothetical protein